MHSGLAYCGADQPLDEVWRTMAEKRIRSVVVVMDASEPESSAWGVISDLDLVAAASVRNIGAQLAAGSAARPTVSITPNETLRRAVQVMIDHDVTELIVTDPSTSHPVGVLSTLDIVIGLTPGL